MKIAIIKLFGNKPEKGTREKIFFVLFNEKLSEDKIIELAIKEKDEQDQPGELVFWMEGQVLKIFDETRIIDLTNTSLWEKIKELFKIKLP